MSEPIKTAGTKTLVIGWFSFEWMGATAGDVIAKDILCCWLRKAGIEPDIAVLRPGARGELRTGDVNPDDYGTVVFVCGPIGNGPPLNEFLDRFPHAKKYALNVTLLQPRAEWNPFAGIIERDSAETTNPDITFAADNASAPVVGLIYVGSQKEYPTNRHLRVEQLVTEVTCRRDVAVVPIDTVIDDNRYGLQSAAQIESTIAKMDAVITTRLHGSVIALRRHVPPVVIDSIPGGSKLLQQMRRIGWPLAYDVAGLEPNLLADALEYALTAEARQRAAEVSALAAKDIARIEAAFVAMLAGENSLPPLR
jgi:hypothetical protein